jgi:hypothetical protein
VTAARLLLAAFFLCFGGAVSAAPLRVAVISDLNGSYGSTNYNATVVDAIEAIVAMKPDLVISTGDMVAGQRRPHLTEPEVRAMWRSFHAMVTDPLARAGIPLAVTPGNHDASAYGGFEDERRIFAEEWRARRPDLDFAGTDDFPFSYAFDLGGVRFASLDVTTVGALEPSKENWLSDVMASAGPTRIVFSHIPLWPVAIGRETEIIGDPELAGLFAELGIDLQLTGHHHAYYPGASGGIAYVAQACLGGGPRALIGTETRSKPGFTLLEIEEDGRIAVSAYTAPDFAQPLDPRTLPAEIVSPLARLQRLDLADLPKVTTGASQ